MQNKIKIAGVIAVAGYLSFAMIGNAGEQTADLGAVLDRTQYVLAKHQAHMRDNGIAEVGEAEMAEFTSFYTEVLNELPFYDEPLGLKVEANATFLGFSDTNNNGVQDINEGKVFTIEIDEENEQLIATDTNGASSGLRFSGSSFLAGAFIGDLIDRQRAAGVTKASFNTRNVAPHNNDTRPTGIRVLSHHQWK